MNIYETDVRHSTFDPKILVANCPQCGNIIMIAHDHGVCDKCGTEVFEVQED